jgi:AAA domain
VPIEFREARRAGVGLLLGFAGGTGSGKTFSAMRVAKGISGDKKFAVIDTEADRALHYADFFHFDHASLTPPFTPARYLEAIVAADKARYPAVVVDSFSHEHAGEGGLLDMQSEELERLTRGNEDARDKMTLKSWIKPKGEHKRLMQRLLQLRTHLILCLRAEPKIEVAKENGRTVFREKRGLLGYNGWFPICEKNVAYEFAAYFMLLAEQPGIPHAIKVQEQHKALFPVERPVDETAGAAIAAWARGGQTNWAEEIAAAKSYAELEAIGHDLARVKGTMTLPALAIVRAAYEARLAEIAPERRAKRKKEEA